jgi:hypothetical protein
MTYNKEVIGDEKLACWELHSLYISLNIISVIKSRKMGWV